MENPDRWQDRSRSPTRRCQPILEMRHWLPIPDTFGFGCPSKATVLGGAAALHFLLRSLFGKRPRGRRLARPRRGSAAPARPPGKSVSPGRLNRRGRLRDVYWFGHGRRVKSALIREVGVRPVHVMIEDCDRFGRMVGTVTCDGRDVGEWLVREGDAIATYDDRYERVEREARRTKRGIWAHTVNTDPRRWRCRSASRN